MPNQSSTTRGKTKSSSEAEEKQGTQYVQPQSLSAAPSSIIYPPTLIVLFGNSWGECGYCQGNRAVLVDRPASASSLSYTFLVSNATLSPRWYQDLINRGWRRSGPAIYKPDNKVSCCPLISIRLPVREFAPTKSQRKLLRKVASLARPPCSIQQPSSTHQSGSPDKKKQKQHSHSKNMELSSRSKEDKANSTNLLSLEQKIIEESGVLTTLSTWTKDILLTLLPSSTETPASIPSTIAFKLFKPQCKKEHKKTGWTAVSNVCAAIAGPSHGKIQRDKLATDLTHTLLARGIVSKTTSPSTSCSAFVSKVEVHEGSGQVIAHICLSGQQQHQQSTVSTPLDENPKICDGSADDLQSKDILAEWWKNEFSSSHGPPPPLVDRSITVETMNAFDSCLDPAVHQLYANYQRVVHNDPDPYSDDLQKFFQSEEVEANGGTGDPWAPFVSRHVENLPKKEGESPSGQWLVQLQRMLHHEYHHLPLRRQARLSHFVARFCEYYVASQFSTTQQQMSVTKKTTAAGNSNNIPCGTYHQHYRINGRLIAVGVLDFLPEGLSSVYLFYSPSFSHNVVALGKYCALKEIAYCQDTLRLPYYFLGYYLHSNTKMRYKADYAPSQLLCFKHNVWVPAAEAIPRIVSQSPRHYCESLSTEVGETDAAKSDVEEKEDMMTGIVENMQLQVNGNHRFKLSELSTDGQAYLRPLLLPFCREAGPKACLECIVDLG